jgi:hypothetical protein
MTVPDSFPRADDLVFLIETDAAEIEFDILPGRYCTRHAKMHVDAYAGNGYLSYGNPYAIIRGETPERCDDCTLPEIGMVTDTTTGEIYPYDDTVCSGCLARDSVSDGSWFCDSCTSNWTIPHVCGNVMRSTNLRDGQIIERDIPAYADRGGKWDAPWSPEFQAKIDHAATITECEKCSKKLTPDESIVCFACASAPSEPLTVSCPECQEKFDVANPDFWDVVRDHNCRIDPMEHLAWDFQECDLGNMHAWHLYPISNAPENVRKCGCHACIYQTIDGGTVVYRQSSRIQEFLTVDDAKNFVAWKISSGTWPMHER